MNLPMEEIETKGRISRLKKWEQGLMFCKVTLIRDTPRNTNSNQMVLMKLMTMELLQVNRQRAKTIQEKCPSMFKRFFDHKPLTYDEKLDPTEFEEWLTNMEK